MFGDYSQRDSQQTQPGLVFPPAHHQIFSSYGQASSLSATYPFTSSDIPKFYQSALQSQIDSDGSFPKSRTSNAELRSKRAMRAAISSAKPVKRKVHRSRAPHQCDEAGNEADDDSDGDCYDTEGVDMLAKRLATDLRKLYLNSPSNMSTSRVPMTSSETRIVPYISAATRLPQLYTDTESDSGDDSTLEYTPLFRRLRTLRPDLPDETLSEICTKLQDPQARALLPYNISQWLFNSLLDTNADLMLSESDEELPSNVFIEEITEDDGDCGVSMQM